MTTPDMEAELRRNGFSRCQPCRGKGYRPDINIPMAIVTFGITALVDTALECRKRCRDCRGLGFTLQPKA